MARAAAGRSASVLDRFQWDVFRWYARHERPAFAAFFSNSTAHYQHVYWRNFEPDAFERRPTDKEQALYADAVRYGYRAMDDLVGEALALADETDATLMLCTALSQQPYVQAEAIGGKFIYRPRRIADVVRSFGIRGVTEVAPVMAEQFHLFFDTAAEADAAASVLAEARVDERAAFTLRVVGSDVFTGCALHDDVDCDARLELSESELLVPFFDLFYRSDTPKSGFHHPDGVWWTRTGVHDERSAPVSLRAVAPTILSLLGIEPTESMVAPAV